MQVVRPDDHVLVEQQDADRGDPEPVGKPDRQPEPGGGKQRDRPRMHRPRPGEDAADAEPRRPRVEPLLAVDLQVEERVEEVEAGDPERDRGAEHPGLPRQLSGDRDPRTDGREAVDRAEPQVSEPREPLQVRVDHERGDRDRP